MRRFSVRAGAVPARISPVRLRRTRQKRRERMLLFLLLVALFLATAFGLYLASRGMHPKQLRHRYPIGLGESGSSPGFAALSSLRRSWVDNR